MNILVIPSWYPPNGGMFFAHQTRWLMDEGLRAAVIAAEEKSLKKFRAGSIPDDFVIKRKDESGIYTYRKTQFRIPMLNRLNAWLWIRTAFDLAEKYILENGKPDLIQAHSCMWGGYVARIIKKKYGIPYIVVEHRGRFNEKNHFRQAEILPWHYPMLKEALINADAIIPVSEKLVSILKEIAGQKLSCISIPNPVDENIFKPGMVQKNDPEITDFLNITNFLPYKATDVLIKAFYLAAQRVNPVRLHFAGDGCGRKQIETLVREYDLADKVFFHGQKTRQEIRDHILACDFLVSSSFNEGQPVSIGETVLCGKPVICTDVVSGSDVPDFAGLIVETGNITELAEAMVFAHKHNKRFDSGRIREFALLRFSRKVVIDRIIGVMNSIVPNAEPV